MPLSIFKSLCNTESTLKEFETFIQKTLPENWGRIKGGEKRSKNTDVKEITKKIQETKNKRRIEIKTKMKLEKNSYIEYIENKGIDIKPLLATCLLTDGSIDIKQNRIEYATKDLTLKVIASYFLHMLSKYPYTIFVDKDNVFHIRLTDKELISKLLKLSPSYKKSPAKNQKAEDF